MFQTCAMSRLGIGLSEANHHEDALSVKEAQLSMERRLGATEENMLTTLGNLADTYEALGRREQGLRMRRDVYFGRLKLNGEEYDHTLAAAYNYAISLTHLERFKEVKKLMRKTTPVLHRVLGNCHDLTLRIRQIYAGALYEDAGASLDDLREAVTTLEDAARIARRVLGGAHPTTVGIEDTLQDAQAALRARETQPSP